MNTAAATPTAEPREFRLPKPAIIAIAILLFMPFGMSSWFLLGFAEELGLPWFLRPILPLTFDAIAILLVSMTVTAVWRFRERAGMLKPLTWLFVAGSASLNYLHGEIGTPDQAYDEYIFAAVSILGPLMFEVVLAKSRRWLRKEANEVGFGARWLIDRKTTRAAWKLSILEGLSADEALEQVRLRSMLAGLAEDERIAYALGALADDEPDRAHKVRVWLFERGLAVSGEALAAVLGQVPVQAGPMTRLDTPAPADRREIERAEPATAERNGHGPAVNVTITNQVAARSGAAAQASAQAGESVPAIVRRILATAPDITDDAIKRQPELDGRNPRTVQNTITQERKRIDLYRTRDSAPVGQPSQN